MRFVTRFAVLAVAGSLVGAAAQEVAAPDQKAAAEKEAKAAVEEIKAGRQAVKTEIYADKAFFDASNNIGIFSGSVKVTDPRFNMQSEKLTVYINKDQNLGLEKAVAEGNVGVVRERPDPKGGPPTRSVGRAENAVYTAKDGNVELSGSPRVQQGLNMHVATSPSTVMILNAKGQLETRGSSRTEIHQDKTIEPEKQ